jgi:hypothetical protein
VAQSHGDRRTAVMALDPDLPDGLAGGAGGCRRGRATGPESGRSGTHAARGSQAAQTEEVHAWTDEQVTQFHGGQRRPSVGRRHRCAVSAPAIRGTGAQVGRPRRGERHVAHRRGSRSRAEGAVWSDANNARSRRMIPCEDETLGLWPATGGTRPRSGWRPGRSGRTMTSSSLRTPAGPSCPTASTGLWRSSSRKQASLAPPGAPTRRCGSPC